MPNGLEAMPRAFFLPFWHPAESDRQDATCAEGRESMVTVTDQATLVLRATLTKARTQPGQTLRLVLSPDGSFGLGVDQKRVGDQVVIAHGENILLIAPDVAEALDGEKIDIQNTNGSRKIVISP